MKKTTLCMMLALISSCAITTNAQNKKSADKGNTICTKVKDACEKENPAIKEIIEAADSTKMPLVEYYNTQKGLVRNIMSSADVNDNNYGEMSKHKRDYNLYRTLQRNIPAIAQQAHDFTHTESHFNNGDTIKYDIRMDAIDNNLKGPKTDMDMFFAEFHNTALPDNYHSQIKYSYCAKNENSGNGKTNTWGRAEFNYKKLIDSTYVATKRFDGETISKIIAPIFKKNGCKVRTVHYRHENVDTKNGNSYDMSYGFLADYMELTPANFGETYGTHYIAPDNETGRVIYEQLNEAIADYCRTHPNEHFHFKPGNAGMSTFILEGKDPTYNGEDRNRPKFNILIDHVNNNFTDFFVLNTVGELWVPVDANVVKDMNDYNIEYYKKDCASGKKYYYEQQEMQGKIKTKRL